MAFKEVTDLSADTVIALGGKDKKTGKNNPTSVTGYFIGSKTVESRKSKNGTAKIHVFQTAKGNLGVWGKTDLDRKMLAVPVGAMVRVTQNGMIPTPNGDMYKYKVEVDSENTIEVSLPAETSASTASSEDSDGPAYAADADDEEETALDEEEAALDEVELPARTAAPRQPAAAADAARQAKVKELLSRGRRQAS